MCTDRNDNCSCLRKTIKLIISLQNKETPACDNETCSRPFLGPTPSVTCLNTRPINLYNCCNGSLWSFPYVTGDTTEESTVFRAESLDDCCLTCRILSANTDPDATEPYIATNSFFTIDLKCVGALKCLADTYVANV